MAPSSDEPTLVTCLTPPGRAAIATLGLRGPRAWEVVRELFRPFATSGKGLPVQPDLSQVWLGRVGEDGKGAADEVVVAVRQITPLPCVELHCHGGAETVRWLLEILEERGCRPCSWHEFERSSAADPWQAAAVEELARASTLRTAEILLDQYHGAFARAIRDILAAFARKDHGAAERIMKGLAQFANVGRHLTAPWKVAVLGAPNVGKSSLVNALAGFQRSVVAATPGTTRDVVTTLIAVDGWLIELTDTAGIREPAEDLEGQGIGLAWRSAADADLCLWVVDASVPPVWPEGYPLSNLNRPFQMVVNKIDLPAVWDLGLARDARRVSALRNEGLGELIDTLCRRLIPDVPPAGAAVPFTPALAKAVEDASRLLGEGRINEAREILSSLRPWDGGSGGDHERYKAQ